MAQEDSEKICFQYICPRYPRCARARGKGCCIEGPEDGALLVGKEECGAENGFLLFVEEGGGAGIKS